MHSAYDGSAVASYHGVRTRSRIKVVLVKGDTSVSSSLWERSVVARIGRVFCAVLERHFTTKCIYD